MTLVAIIFCVAKIVLDLRDLDLCVLLSITNIRRTHCSCSGLFWHEGGKRAHGAQMPKLPNNATTINNKRDVLAKTIDELTTDRRRPSPSTKCEDSAS